VHPRADVPPGRGQRRRRPPGQQHGNRGAGRREHPGGQDDRPRRGEQRGCGHHGCGPGERRGHHRHRSPDHEILGLLGVTDQSGQQVAAVPAGQPGRDQVLQPAVQPPTQPGLHPEPEVVAGQPLGVAGGAAQQREQLPMAMDSSRIGGRSEADSSSQPPVASSPSALSSPASPIPTAASTRRPLTGPGTAPPFAARAPSPPGRAWR